MKPPADEAYARQRDESALTLAAGFLALAALLTFYIKQDLLLYGDAVAHINIARRVVDNRHPIDSLSQLGTVWLPLQHIAMLPLVWINALWQTSIAGAIPGLVAYILGTLAIFRLVRAHGPRLAAWVAAGIYALNPNLIYLQTTAMNEPIFLAFFLWSLVFLDEFLGSAFSSANSISPARTRRALELCGITVAGGAFTRYDGWFTAIVLLPLLLVGFVAWWRQPHEPRQRRALAKSLTEVLVLNALVPVFWLIYTYFVSGRALDFLNGPYSAKAIAARTTAKGTPPYPGQHDPFTALVYFLKAAKLNLGPAAWGQLFLALAIAGTAVAVWRYRRSGWLLLLWLPLPFYVFSLAYGSVPIFLPVWYPFSYYNVRYGLELLPVFAVFPALLIGALESLSASHRIRAAVWGLLIAFAAGSYAAVYVESPITLREAQENSRGRIYLEVALARALREMPPSATLLMYGGDHVGALQMAGIPLRRVITEGEHPDWEWATAQPLQHADYMVACAGDPVDVAVRPYKHELTELLAVSAPWQARCVLYRRATPR